MAQEEWPIPPTMAHTASRDGSLPPHEATVSSGAAASPADATTATAADTGRDATTPLGDLPGRTSTSTQDDNVVDKPALKRKRTNREKISDASDKARAHFKKYWMWHLLGFIIFLAILLPLLFKVIIPAIVQDIIKKQDLPILSASFLTQSASVLLVKVNTALKTPIPAKTNNFTLELYNRDTPDYSPWIRMDVPGLSLSGYTKFTIPSQKSTILNSTELSKWFGKFFDEEEIGLDVRGEGITVKLGALNSKPKLDKTVKFKGLNRLKGMDVERLDIVLPPKNGENLKGMINLPNHSPIELGLGDTTFNLKTGDLDLGSISLPDVVLKPGNNSLPFSGYLNLNEVVSNLSPFLAAQSDALGEGKVQLNITGNHTTKGGERVKFAEEVLNSRTLSVRISVVTLLSDLVSGLLKSNGDITGNGPSDGSSFINSISKVFSNGTLMDRISDHWKTAEQLKAEDGGSKEKRVAMDPKVAFKLLQMGLKLKAGGAAALFS